MIQTLRTIRHLTTSAMKLQVSELRVPVPWGEMRGQVWGPDHGHPVLCIHGWADNSGSFNHLIPRLPSAWRYVAIDLPGHGLSSHRPAGVFYTFPSYVADVRRVVEALQWERFSIIGHSMGGNVASMPPFMLVFNGQDSPRTTTEQFSAAFPEMVERIVLLDSYGFLPIHEKRFSGLMNKGIEEMIQYEKKAANRTERVYTYDAAKERLKVANPSLSDESVQTLLERGVQEVEGGVVFTRDIRINLTNIIRITLEQSLQVQSKIKAKVLILRANQGLVKTFPQPEEFADPLLKGWTDQGNTLVFIEGDHHVHLNNPELVAPVITDFLLSHTSEHTANASKL